jgi:hypothetical protein
MAAAKITKKLAIVTLIGALAGGLAACDSSGGGTSAPGSAAGTTTAPAPSPTQPKADPTKDMAAWVAAGGADDFNSIGKCLSVMSAHPTLGQIRALDSAIKKARSHPIPVSVDPKGAYNRALGRFQKAVTAYEKGDVFTAASEINSTSTDMKTLQDEMKAAGFEVNS